MKNEQKAGGEVREKKNKLVCCCRPWWGAEWWVVITQNRRVAFQSEETSDTVHWLFKNTILTWRRRATQEWKQRAIELISEKSKYPGAKIVHDVKKLKNLNTKNVEASKIN